MQKQGNNVNKPGKIHSYLKRRRNKAKKKGRRIPVCCKQEFKDWYWEQERKCYYCGIPEALLKLLGWQHKYQPRLTIERKKSNEGYTLGNIVLACERCNAIKNDFLTVTEMKDIARRYLRPRWKKLYESQKCEK